jgi:hypothetical protein
VCKSFVDSAKFECFVHRLCMPSHHMSKQSYPQAYRSQTLRHLLQTRIHPALYIKVDQEGGLQWMLHLHGKVLAMNGSLRERWEVIERLI